jgi:hypothetical protein
MEYKNEGKDARHSAYELLTVKDKESGYKISHFILTQGVKSSR